jgi:hypothetical protein
MRIRRWNGDRTATDDHGRVWALTEAALVAKNSALSRLPSHNAFWFGWRAADPDTDLIAGAGMSP